MSVEFTDNTAKIKDLLKKIQLNGYMKQVVKFSHKHRETAGLIPDKQKVLTNM